MLKRVKSWIFKWAFETRIQVKSVFMNRTPIPGMNKDSYWVGLSRNKDGGMEWTDGSVVVSNLSACLTIFKLECVIRMVVDYMLPHAECEPNNHRKDAPPFSLNILDLCQLGTRRTIGNMEWRS